MTQTTSWHREWQSNFERTEVSTVATNRRADVVVNDTVLEVQHSYINKMEVSERNADYKRVGYRVVWLVDCTVDADVHDLETTKRVFIDFGRAAWKYRSFEDCDAVYVDTADDRIFRIDVALVRGGMVDVKESKTRKEFVKALKDDTLNDLYAADNHVPQTTLHLKQQGAGNGKTYTAVQMIANAQQFGHIRRFIYVTKAHSAKDVICKELKEQIDGNKLEEMIVVQAPTPDGKRYKATMRREGTNGSTDVTIATVDSLVYGLSCGNMKEARKRSADVFKGLCKLLQDSTSKIGSSYVGNSIDKECMIVVDEAQDLPKHYFKALARVVRDTYVNVCFIGDKLQSIFDEDNSFIDPEMPHTTVVKYEQPEATNICRRFGPRISGLVNRVVGFEAHQLPPITPHPDTDQAGDYTLFIMDSIRSTESTSESNDRAVDNECRKIMKYMELEYANGQTRPEDFLFVFPFVKKNPLANELETRISAFWIAKGKHEEGGEVCAELHRSEEGKPIDTSTSKYKTRMVSIHSSKGDGRDVVFFLQAAEWALERFSGPNSRSNNSIVYESLLHVGITRAKKKLYVGLPSTKDDDIRKRFYGLPIEDDSEAPPRMRIRKTHIAYCTKIAERLGDEHNPTNHHVVKSGLLEAIAGASSSSEDGGGHGGVVDHEHHTWRWMVMHLGMISSITTTSPSTHTQLPTRLRMLARMPIRPGLTSKEYWSYIKQFGQNGSLKEIPIIRYDVQNYKEIHDELDVLMQEVQRQCRHGVVPDAFCRTDKPFMGIVLLYMLMIVNQKQYSDLSINKVYSLMRLYMQKKDDKTNQSVKMHYSHLHATKHTFQHLMQCTFMRGDKWTWNYNHPVTLTHDVPDQFTLREQLPFVAHAANKIMVCMLEPQYNALNTPAILFRAALIVHLLQRAAESEGDRHDGKTGNVERFSAHKQVRVCVFTLGSTRPIHLSERIGEIVKTHSGLLQKCIREYVRRESGQHHHEAGRFYEHFYKLEGESGPTKRLTDRDPSYVDAAFSNAEDALEDDERLNITQVVKSHLDNQLRKIMRKKFLTEDRTASGQKHKKQRL